VVLAEESVGAPTRQKCRMLLLQVFDDALENGHVRQNPVSVGRSGRRGIKGPDPKPARTLSAPEIVSVVEAARKRSLTDAVLIQLMYFGGLRIGEAFALQARDVDLARAEVTVQRSV
jgi:integrase